MPPHVIDGGGEGRQFLQERRISFQLSRWGRGIVGSELEGMVGVAWLWLGQVGPSEPFTCELLFLLYTFVISIVAVCFLTSFPFPVNYLSDLYLWCFHSSPAHHKKEGSGREEQKAQGFSGSIKLEN